VVILDNPIKFHVIQRMRNHKLSVLR